MNKNLHKNTKDELIEEILKLRKKNENLKDKNKDLNDEVKGLK
jgi:cell division protein FtsB